MPEHEPPVPPPATKPLVPLQRRPSTNRSEKNGCEGNKKQGTADLENVLSAGGTCCGRHFHHQQQCLCSSGTGQHCVLEGKTGRGPSPETDLRAFATVRGEKEAPSGLSNDRYSIDNKDLMWPSKDTKTSVLSTPIPPNTVSLLALVHSA